MISSNLLYFNFFVLLFFTLWFWIPKQVNCIIALGDCKVVCRFNSVKLVTGTITKILSGGNVHGIPKEFRYRYFAANENLLPRKTFRSRWGMSPAYLVNLLLNEYCRNSQLLPSGNFFGALRSASQIRFLYFPDIYFLYILLLTYMIGSLP